MEPNGNDISDVSAIFNLDLEDTEIVRLLKTGISESKNYFEGRAKGALRLKEKRDKNKRFWQGDHYDGIDLYEHQVDYTDNAVYVAVETTIPMVTARIAQPSVLPGNSESAMSIELARDIEKALFRLAEINNLDHKMEIGARDLLLQYVGVLKVRFDPDHGKQGEIQIDVVDPSRIVVDHNCDLFGEPRFIAEQCYGDIVELIQKFPDKKDQLLKKFALDWATIHTDTRRHEYWEVHFSYYDKQSYERREGVVWFMENNSFVLGKMETPNWLPENKEGVKKNFFDMPTKPYIFINYINSGRKKIDDNAPIDHSIKQQEIVNKRGRQITENADNAQGGIVYNTEMISTDDVAKLIGAPDEKVGVTGDVQRAFARVAPPLLPQYVQEQLYDARNRIDEYFATHSVTRGEQSEYNTLGEAVIQKNQDFSRHDKLVQAIERATLNVYKMFLQFMKVYYTEEHYLLVAGENGQFDHVVIRGDRIEDGLDVNVQKGSTAPLNKEQNRADIIALANKGMADPYTVLEVIQTGIMPSPQKMMERLLKWLAQKAEFLQSVQEDEMNREAMKDIELLNRGEKVEARSEPTAEYLESRNNYIASGEFLDLPRNIQNAHIENLQKNKENAQRMLSLKEALANTTAQDLAAPVAEARAATQPPPVAPDPGMAPTGLPPEMQPPQEQLLPPEAMPDAVPFAPAVQVAPPGVTPGTPMLPPTPPINGTEPIPGVG